MAASKEKPLVPEPEATDGLAAIQARSATACGAVGTVEEFRANRHAGLAKRTEKAQKKAAAKRKREEDEIARRTKACHEGATLDCQKRAPRRRALSESNVQSGPSSRALRHQAPDRPRAESGTLS